MRSKRFFWMMLLLPAFPITSLPLAAAPASVASVLATPQELAVTLSKAQSASFSDALDALAAQGHVAIVAEGAPLVPHLAEKDVPDLTKAVPLSAALAKIAAAYDYDVQKPDAVFLLTKRYTNPRELPCVTLGECRQAFVDVQTLLNRFNPQFDERSEDHSEHGAVAAFFGSLTPTQMQASQTKTLHYIDLTPEQQGIVQSIILDNLVNASADEVQAAANALDHAPQSVLTGRNGNDRGLFIQTPQLSNKAAFDYWPLYSDDATRSYEPQLIPPAPKAAGPLPEPKTLGEVVGLLLHAGPPPAVDAALKDKPVSVAGLSRASSQDILKAFAALYRLRIGVSDAGGPLLERQFLTTDSSLQNFVSNVWATLPVSFCRALHQEDVQAALRVRDHPDETNDDFTKAVSDLQNRRFEGQALSALRTEAEHQVVAGVRPQFLKQGANARIPVKSLSIPAQRALAVALSGGALEAIKTSLTDKDQQNLTDCLDDMNDIVVYTVPSEVATIHGQTVPSIYITGTDPYTRQQVHLGGVQFFSIQ